MEEATLLDLLSMPLEKRELLKSLLELCEEAVDACWIYVLLEEPANVETLLIKDKIH